jgi:hypothetical protein
MNYVVDRSPAAPSKDRRQNEAPSRSLLDRGREALEEWLFWLAVQATCRTRR